MNQPRTQSHDSSVRTTGKPIIFFDGVCGMCNAFATFIVKVDRKNKFLLAPLQGTTAGQMLPPPSDDAKQWSMIYVDERGMHRESDSSLEVLRRLGGVWWLVSLIRFIPRFLRDPAYRFVARNRYRWFKKKDACRIPTPSERAKFLD